MRENIGLFKAKDINTNEWVEGFYFNFNARVFLEDKPTTRLKHCIVLNDTVELYIEIEIDPETLCECTGLKDKNGKLIFENDIVKFSFRYGLNREKFVNENLIVKWSDEFLSYEFSKSKWDACFISGLKNEFEVIGNKFDNK